MTIRVGLIGLSAQGWASGAYIPALDQLKEYQLSALLTSREESSKAAGSKYSVTAYHGDPAQIANDPNVDLVLVSVRVPAHKESLWPAIEAGKLVICEWPLGRNLAEAKEIADFAAQKGVRTLVGLQARQGRAVLKAKELIESGNLIGRVLSTTMIGSGGVWGPSIDSRNEYLTDRSNGATLLSIPTSHALDAFALVLGEFASLSALLSTQRKSVEVTDKGTTVTQTSHDQVLIQAELSSGAVANIHFRGSSVGNQGGIDFYWEIQGEKGTITFKGPTGHIQMSEPSLFLNGDEIKFDKDELGNVGRQLDAFAKGDTQNYVDFAHAVKRHEVIDAIERSAAEGKRVFL